jgi:hypothetical protein
MNDSTQGAVSAVRIVLLAVFAVGFAAAWNGDAERRTEELTYASRSERSLRSAARLTRSVPGAGGGKMPTGLRGIASGLGGAGLVGVIGEGGLPLGSTDVADAPPLDGPEEPRTEEPASLRTSELFSDSPMFCGTLPPTESGTTSGGAGSPERLVFDWSQFMTWLDRGLQRLADGAGGTSADGKLR